MVVDCFVCIHLYALSHNIRYNINMKNQFDEKTATTSTNCKFNQKIQKKLTTNSNDPNSVCKNVGVCVSLFQNFPKLNHNTSR